jgi:ParB-like chromosome segregation protein Spo0J
MSEQEYAAFRADVANRGVLVALSATSDGIVLDGRARLRAACEVGLASVPVTVVDPVDEIEFILLAALRHRHLTASQKAALAVELDSYRLAQEQADARRRSNLKQSATEVATLPPRGKTRELAAAIAGARRAQPRTPSPSVRATPNCSTR